jgi:hypothetical protein
MTTELEIWLEQATRRLSKDSSLQVRREIQEHFESAREAAINCGATEDEADRSALFALGNAREANCQYRSVLLTSEEARLLRESNWEARAVCSRPWLKGTLVVIPAVAVLASLGFLIAGSIMIAKVLLAGGIGMSLWCAAPFLPLYTPSRARVFRVVKWVVLLVALGLALQWSWLLALSLWPLAWIEWRRVSIRRKLPVAQWPRQLYL